MAVKQITKKSAGSASTNQKFKEIVKQAVQEYFEQSGINQILVTLYESRNKPATSPQTRKVKSLLDNNPKAAPTRERSAEDWMQDSGLFDQPVFLPESKNKTNNITPNLTSVINQFNDPVATGQSILDDFENLPDFLAKGLSKIAKG